LKNKTSGVRETVGVMEIYTASHVHIHEKYFHLHVHITWSRGDQGKPTSHDAWFWTVLVSSQF